MNRIKNRIKKSFTVAPNELINDRNIDSRARFIYIYMASKPDTWEFNNRDLMQACGIKDKRTLVKLMKELIDSGWISREEQNRVGGKFSTYDYSIHAEPICKKCTTVEDSPRYISSVAQNLRGAKNAPHSNKESIVKKKKNKKREEGEKENSPFEKIEVIENGQKTLTAEKAEKAPPSCAAPPTPEPEPTNDKIGRLVLMRRAWDDKKPRYIWQDHDQKAINQIYWLLKQRLEREKELELGMKSKVLVSEVVDYWKKVLNNLPTWIEAKGYMEVSFIQKKINSILDGINDKKEVTVNSSGAAVIAGGVLTSEQMEALLASI